MDTNRPIRDIMTQQPVTIYPEDSFEHTATLFKAHTFHHLPVVEPGNRLVGIISKQNFQSLYDSLARNTTGKTWTEKELQRFCARDIMTKNPVHLDPDDSIGLAADIFLANQFHALPIVEDQQLIGIVTAHDLLAYSFKSTV